MFVFPEVNQFRHQLVHLSRLVFDLLHFMGDERWQVKRLEDGIDLGDDQGQRRSEFMAGAGEKAKFRFVQFFLPSTFAA